MLEQCTIPSLGNDHLILEAKRVGLLRSRLGDSIVINHPVGYRPETLAEKGLIDCIIVDTEDGFSQLGMMRQFLSQDLGFLQGSPRHGEFHIPG